MGDYFKPREDDLTEEKNKKEQEEKEQKNPEYVRKKHPSTEEGDGTEEFVNTGIPGNQPNFKPGDRKNKDEE